MKRFALASTLSIAGLILMGATSASAQAYDPNVARVANPANACMSIPGSAEYAGALLGFPVDTSSFDYAACVEKLAKGDAFVEPAEEFGSPYVQCDLLVNVFHAFSYPATLHNDPNEFEDSFLPDLTVKNQKECGSALYAFHAIFEFFPPEPPAAG
jgi:hypothetical protein